MRLRSVWVVSCVGAVVAVGAAAADVHITYSTGSVVAYIRDSGRVEDASFRTLGYVRTGGRVEDMRFRTLGFVRDDGSVEDASYWNIGRVRGGGSVEDASSRVVGYVREGVIQDPRLVTVGFYDASSFTGDVDAALAAYVFFFSPALFTQPEWATVHKP
jgi:hypothetical protein